MFGIGVVGPEFDALCRRGAAWLADEGG